LYTKFRKHLEFVMENYVKCFQTCTKCLISMSFLLSLVCVLTVSVHLLKENPIISEYLIYYKNLFGALAFSFSILLVTNAAIGIFSLISKSSKAIKIYHIFGFFLSILAFGFSIIIFYQCSIYRSYYNPKDLCNVDKDFADISKIYQKSKDLFCSEECPCNLNNSYDEYEADNFIISNKGANSVQECPNLESFFTKEEQKSFYSLNSLENVYECSGICEENPIFMFSDINKGQPRDMCTNSIFKMLFNLYILIGSVFIVNSFILLIFSINSAFIYHNSNEKLNYYEKLTP